MGRAVNLTNNSYLTEKGQLYTWGDGSFGKLGHGDTRGRPEPQLVHEFVQKKVSYIACGWSNTAAITGLFALISVNAVSTFKPNLSHRQRRREDCTCGEWANTEDSAWVMRWINISQS